MGNKAENKKMKRTKRHRSLGNGESTEGANKSECDDKSPTIANNEEDTPPARATTSKSKKARRNKNKDAHTPDEHHNEVNQKDGTEPEPEDCPMKGKGKSKKARRNKNKDAHTLDEHNEVNQEDGTEPESEHCLMKGKGNKSKKARKNKNKDTHTPDKHHNEVNQVDGTEPESDHCPRKRKAKSKKARKISKGSNEPIVKSKSAVEVRVVSQQDVYQISSGDEDCSKGMKKWIKKYHEDRPGLTVLQQRIDDFITAHEEQEEQAKKEREARIAEDGWTVVVHRKGGKKTTDPDSGVAVGSVAEVAVRDKLAKKKSKDVGIDFYRFQRREAKRDEIMQLQSKFEEDRKRIQQLRAARKFRPY